MADSGRSGGPTGAVRPATQLPTGWPFFAPSQSRAVDEAFELVGLDAGHHLVDLGCGDGRVLVAAAERGARVTGIESDRALVRAAREALAGAGIPQERWRVVAADLFASRTWGVVSDADVLFGYLSPAVLQRLTPGLRRLGDGSRCLVTVDFEVPDLRPDERRGVAQLYRLPGRRRRRARPAQVGWPSAASLCVMPPEVNSLTCLEAIHSGGQVAASLGGRLTRHASLVVGTVHTERGRPVALDVRWRPRPDGTLATGEARIAGLPAHPVVVLFAQEDQGQWDLSVDAYRSLLFRLRQRRLPRPTTTAGLLAAATSGD
jgi:SAM-dependent methyltransferase